MIEVRELVKRYGSKAVAGQVSCAVPYGPQGAGLFASNRAGSSALLGMLFILNVPTLPVSLQRDDCLPKSSI
ncbi:hypothetical protein [Streptomyces sp. NPDC053427]|uniref:hypothetical protein n=1 Tax=Streptomyces sp. NPDC053427 TaxID=3365701 RepID=UPI0037D2F4A6